MRRRCCCGGARVSTLFIMDLARYVCRYERHLRNTAAATKLRINRDSFAKTVMRVKDRIPTKQRFNMLTYFKPCQ